MPGVPVQEYHLLRRCLLIVEKTIIVIETQLTFLYILQVFIVIWLMEASLYKMQHI